MSAFDRLLSSRVVVVFWRSWFSIVRHFSVVTKPCGGVLPFDIKDQLNRRGLSDIVMTAGNEKALLSLFLAKIQKYEPDVIVVSSCMSHEKP